MDIVTEPALFWLDGTISGSEFVDATGNGRNFTINNKDFTASYFPYKSAATISAPAGDATLIAADINNFLYDSGGTPNEIPVVSFFQNIDYEDKLFCRHVSQTIDGDNVETQEPYVIDIVLYGSALTGGDLTIANEYFSVPTEETSNVKWVTKAGNDTTGDGSKATPWLTIDKAVKSATANDTVYITTGEYTEANGALEYLYVDETLDFKGIGNVVVQSDNTDRVVYLVSGNATFEGLIFDGEGTTADVVDTYTANAKVMSMTRCKVMGATGQNIDGHAILTLSLYNCVFVGNKVCELFNISIISGCYVNGRLSLSGFDDGEIKYNTILSATNTSILVRILKTTTNSAPIILDNKMTSYGRALLVDDVTANTVSPVITYNEITVIWTVESASVYTAIEIDDEDCIPDIEHNTINLSGADATDYCYGVYIKNGQTPTIKYNIIDMESKTQNQAIIVTPQAGYSVGKVICNYNTILSNSLSGADLSIGGESNIDGSFDNSEVIGNYYSGYLRNYPSEAASTHAFLISCGINITISHNYIANTALGLVVKSNGTVYTTNGVHNNVFLNCSKAMWIRAVHGLNIYNNTIVVDGAITDPAYVVEFGIYMDEDSTNPGVYCEDITCRNNIFWDNGEGDATTYFFGMDAHAAAFGCTFDYCLGGDESSEIYYKFGATNYSNLADAQAAGLMLNSLAADPLLKSNFSLQSNSPCVGSGVTLPKIYNNQLAMDYSYSSLGLTKQIVPWNMGAIAIFVVVSTNIMTTNYYVFGFGKVKFSRTIGGSLVEAIFESRAKIRLVPLGISKEDIDYNIVQRIKKFRGFINNTIDNYNATQSASLIKLINMISDLVHTSGSGNKTITMIPAYSTEENAVNQEFEVSIKLGSNIGALMELAENVESVQFWDFSWIVLDAITTIPTNTTIDNEVVLTGDDGETLTGDDGEDLTEG